MEVAEQRRGPARGLLPGARGDLALEQGADARPVRLDGAPPVLAQELDEAIAGGGRTLDVGTGDVGQRAAGEAPRDVGLYAPLRRGPDARELVLDRRHGRAGGGVRKSGM
jgi:hypothetical protein